MNFELLEKELEEKIKSEKSIISNCLVSDNIEPIRNNIVKLEPNYIEFRNITNIEELKRVSLLKLLEFIKKIDFEEKCISLGYKPNYDKNGITKAIPQKNLKVAIIDELIEVAKMNNWHLAKDGSFFYIFNGALWLSLQKDEIQNFLKDVSIKMSYPCIEAKDERFKELLYKQMLSDGFFSDKNYYKKSNINLQNGTLVIEYNQVSLKDFDYRDFLTHQLDFGYDEKASNELFLNYLDSVLPNKETQKTLQEIAGYMFINDLKLELSFFLFGTGGNGKSVFFEILNGVIGQDNISSYSLESLTDEQGYHRARIKDKLINYGTDVKLSKIDPAMFKTLSSGEPIEARLPYQEPFIMRDYAKLIFNVNRLDNANIEHTNGFYRRILIIPFVQTINENEQDKDLPKKILKNKAGVLNWIIEGTKRVISNRKIFVSKECEAFKNQFIKETDNVALFIEEEQYSKDTHSKTYLSSLYKYYSDYCSEYGYKSLSKNNFSKRIESIGFEKKRDNQGIYFAMSK